MFIIVFLASITSAIGADPGRAKRVLMLSTESRFALRLIPLEQALTDGLRPDLGPIEFYAEYLDVNRFPGEEYQRKFTEYLREKYAQRRPDLLLIFYTRTLEMFGSLLRDLFHGEPSRLPRHRSSGQRQW